MITQTVTTQGLDVFEAAVKISYTSENICYAVIREVLTGKDNLHGPLVSTLQRLICIFEEPQAEDLRNTMLKDWLLKGY
jgi:hypothetical protein